MLTGMSAHHRVNHQSILKPSLHQWDLLLHWFWDWLLIIALSPIFDAYFALMLHHVCVQHTLIFEGTEFTDNHNDHNLETIVHLVHGLQEVFFSNLVGHLSKHSGSSKRNFISLCDMAKGKQTKIQNGALKPLATPKTDNWILLSFFMMMELCYLVVSSIYNFLSNTFE